uniref:DUF4346 domain-containing protein n=1 Tax=Neoizziella asiatica TaxID=1077397 RepID=A0A1G4NWT3_9FLOR|nr:Hypothetical protein ORF_1 [Neoizziella asiatica]SCW23151.1 Hypothetical protein ORF_1 [Neoizziella asiatica]
MSLIYKSVYAHFSSQQLPCLSYRNSMIVQDDIYCKIYIVSRTYLCVKFYASDYSVDVISSMLRVVFISTNAQSMVKLINSHIWITSKLSISHALYIGGELVKAELTLITGQEYIQD